MGKDTKAPAEEPPAVYDGIPFINKANELKEEGNSCIKRKAYNEAVGFYERAIAVLDQADGQPMLRTEVMEMISIKAVLFCNLAQCFLSQELFRRAVEAATSCLTLDTGNAKALHRRSLAYEALRKHEEALADAEALKKLGGGALTADTMEARLAVLRDKKAAVDKAKEEESSGDEGDMSLVNLKERFDEVVEKYNLRDGSAAGEVADWLVSGEWSINCQRVAQRWKMEELDAEIFLQWIWKGLQFKNENSRQQALAESNTPSLDA